MMAKSRSSIKRAEIIARRTLRNRALKSNLRSAIKRVETAAPEEAPEKLHNALVTIDKAVTKGVLHKNAAARKKSRLTKRFSATS